MKQYMDILKNISTMELKSRVLLISMAAGMLICFFAAGGNLVLGLGIAAALIPFAMGIFYVYFLYALYIKKRYRVAAYGSLFLLTFVVFPFLWFFNGGLVGSIPYFYIFMIFLSSVVLHGYRYKTVMAVQIIVVFGLIVTEYRHPQWINPYENLQSQLIDMGYSLIIITLLVFGLVTFIMRSYHETFEQLKEARDKLIELNSSLQIASMTDELTQLSNRRYIINLINARISEKSLAGTHVLMLDIDHFKKINDTFGHSKGDDVLKRISALLKNRFDASHAVARLGGEEFLVALNQTETAAVMHIAEDLRKSIASLPWREPALQATVSIGVYQVEDDNTLEHILHCVDEALYAAKNNGRNQIRMYVEEASDRKDVPLENTSV